MQELTTQELEIVSGGASLFGSEIDMAGATLGLINGGFRGGWSGVRVGAIMIPFSPIAAPVAGLIGVALGAAVGALSGGLGGYEQAKQSTIDFVNQIGGGRIL